MQIEGFYCCVCPFLTKLPQPARKICGIKNLQAPAVKRGLRTGTGTKFEKLSENCTLSKSSKFPTRKFKKGRVTITHSLISFLHSNLKYVLYVRAFKITAW